MPTSPLPLGAALAVFAALIGLVALLPAQQQPAQPPPGLMASMKQMSAATLALEQAIAAGDVVARARELATLESVVDLLRQEPPALEPRHEVELTLGDLASTLADLRKPGPDAAATDRYDLARLRNSCTTCHLQTRTGNDERGLFPNRGGALFGRLQLEQQDGTAMEERGGLVVFLEGPQLKSPPLPRKPVISQKGRSFQPTVLAVPVGTTVRFPNDDVVFHNVFSLSRGNAFDLDIYGKGIEKERVLGTPGLVKVHCNIHPDMVANVLVLESSHAAITRASGFWTLPEVPPGDYTLRVWHPLADGQQQTVRVTAEAATEVPITVRETKARVQHTNKFGRPYKKY